MMPPLDLSRHDGKLFVCKCGLPGKTYYELREFTGDRNAPDSLVNRFNSRGEAELARLELLNKRRDQSAT